MVIVFSLLDCPAGQGLGITREGTLMSKACQIADVHFTILFLLGSCYLADVESLLAATVEPIVALVAEHDQVAVVVRVFAAATLNVV
jgi:hypothetical protein